MQERNGHIELWQMVKTMAMKLPESIADVLNNASDANAIDASVKLFLRSKDTIKRYPADLAYMLKGHFKMAEITEEWAQPKSKMEKDTPNRIFDWRGREVVAGNQIPILDISWRKVQGSDRPQRVYYYRRFVERLSTGKAIADILDVMRKVKAGPDTYDLTALNTIVPIETFELSGDGTSNVIMKDARGMSGTNVAKYVGALDRKLNDLADNVGKGVLLLRQWHEINTRAEFKGHVELDWNWANGKNPTDGLHANGLPFILRSVERTKNEETGETVIRYPADKPLRWEDVLKFDLDKAATAVSAEGSKVSPYTAILDNPWKAPDDKAGAGQGSTADQKQRKSAIKVTGEGNIGDVLTELVYFFRDPGTVSAMTNWMYNQLDVKERDDVVHNIVRVRNLIDKNITDEMEKTFDRVEKAIAEAEKAEVERKAKLEAERLENERAPTQNDKATQWRREQEARDRDAEAQRVLASMSGDDSTQERDPAATPQPEAQATSSKKTAATSSKKKAV